MKKVFILFLLLIFGFHSNAQFTKIWDYRYGGNNDDFTGGIIATDDGGALCWGYSYSGMTNDKSEPLKGFQDYWVVKADANGIMQWNKSFGGANSYNYMTCVMETQDRGFILGGFTPADSSFDKSEDNRGNNDYWIIRIDSFGNKLWDKTYGTNKDDYMSCVYATSDGGFLLGGTTTADISFDKTTVGQGHLDYWIIKTDSNGQYQWDKDYGGTKDDYLSRVVETFDGGFYLSGVSYSNMSGDKTEDSKGSTDFWIIKTDSNGNYLWDRDYGSNGTEGTLSNFSFMDITLDNGAILATTTNGGISGDKTVSNWGIYNDFWAVRLDSLGNKLWDQHYGGTADEDEFYNVWHTADSGFLISGSSYSGISGDKSESNGAQAEQAWCIKVDGNGNKIWDKTLHTEDHNEGGMCTETTGGCIILNTYTNANAGGDKTQDSWANSYDYFFAKFCYGSLLPISAFIADDTAGCEMFCASFTDQSTNTPTSWLWSFPGGNPSTSSLQNPLNICYSNAGVFDVTLISSSSFGSDTLTLPGYITVFTPVAFSISQNGNLLTCNPAASGYQWLLNGNAIAGATSQSINITDTGTYSVETIDENGCSSVTIINVTSLPSPAFFAADTAVCEKFCLSFFDSSTNNPTSWQWTFQGGDPAFSTDQDPANICYNNPGVFDVTLITTNAAGADTLIQPGYITVYPTPALPVISQTGYVLTSSPAPAYQWQFNNVDIAGATNQSYDVTQTGYYAVLITDENGCTASATVYVLITGVEDVLSDGNLLIYPNPSNGHLIVEWFNGLMVGQTKVEVSNILGEIVYSSAIDIEGNHFMKTLDLKDLSEGIYILILRTEMVEVKKKIMIAD